MKIIVHLHICTTDSSKIKICQNFKDIMGPIMYFFDGRFLCQESRHKQFLYLAGALMEHSLEGIGMLRHWYINPNGKSKTNTNLLF